MLLKIFQRKWVILVVLLLPIAIYVLRYDKGQQLSFLDNYNDKHHLNKSPVEVNVSFKQLEHLANMPDTFLHSTKNGYKKNNEQPSILLAEQTTDKQGSNQQQNSLQLVNQPEKIDKQQSKLPTKKVEQKQSTLLPKDKQGSEQQQNPPQLVNQPAIIDKQQSKLPATNVEQKQSTLLPKDKQGSEQQQNSPQLNQPAIIDKQQSKLATKKVEQKQSALLPKDKQGSEQQQNPPQLVNQPAIIDKQQSKLPATNVEQKQSTLLPKDKQDSKQQQNSAIQPVKIDQVLVSLSKKDSKFKNYITKNLSSSQVEDLLQQMGVNNLTSRKAQNQFLQCGGMLILRRLNGLDPQTSISLIPSHQHCKNMSFKSSGPLVSLSSIPGSGNSWVRQLLEAATGIYTGAIYCDPTYVSDGMIGEFVQTNNVLAVKIHFNIPSATKKTLNNDKSIYIVRSPFGAILAEHTRGLLVSSRKSAESHVIEIDFKYGMCIMIIEK